MIDNKTIRKVIMLNKMLPSGSPTYENREAEGAVANFTTNVAMSFVSLDCEILPIQEGTGTPSPSNPRPISGTSVLDIYHSGADTSDYATTSVNLGQTVYGGTADVVGGTGEETSAVIDLGSLTWYGYTWGFQSVEVITGINPPATDNDITTAICEQYSPASANAVFASVSDSIFGIRGGNGRVVIHDSTKSGMTASEFKTAMTGIKLAYPLATPTEYTFTGQPINSLLGVNNVWTEAGDTKVTYKYKTGEGGSTKKKYLPIFYDFYRKDCRHL